MRRLLAMRVGRRAADELDDRRRRRHREAADAGGFGDRRIAEVGRGIGDRVAGEVEAVDRVGRCLEPVSPVPERRTPKLTPLRAIAVTIELPGTPAAASHIALHAAIERLRKKWSLPAMKAERAVAAARRVAVRAAAGGEALEQQRGRGGVAVVNLVAHVQRLRHQRLELRIGQPAHGELHGGEELAGHPAQPVDDLGGVGAEAQHLARALR